MYTSPFIHLSARPMVSTLFLSRADADLNSHVGARGEHSVLLMANTDRLQLLNLWAYFNERA
jgi:hypothetical protein